MNMEQAPVGIDPAVPSVARIYDYLLGGTDNFPSDRAAADKLAELTPNIREGVQANRRFLSRAVRFLAENGIRQFLDIGAGLPTQENVHQVALRVAPDSRIVYVDNDPIVLAQGGRLLADDPRSILLDGDLREPEAILSDPRVRAHIDFDKPVALLLLAVLHFIPEDDVAERAVRTLCDRLPSGSGLVINHLSFGDIDDGKLEEGREVYRRTATGSVTPRTRTQILGFFDGFELAEPGLVSTGEWRPEPDEPRIPKLPGIDGFSGVGLRR
ncbi:SAM-dependent methyltransferase [Planotetraspora kaengkrachanensis]|uniref:S-adenosyl methyltransferase n=1 Tax=Planotetraspora kaengkrachanensis TaxID=575193 RepID=A0A8J3LSF8_9ACTN|nr:hypothetical protein Pka01_10640 [Planotetraspora kaengkrachanensis]